MSDHSPSAAPASSSSADVPPPQQQPNQSTSAHPPRSKPDPTVAAAGAGGSSAPSQHAQFSSSIDADGPPGRLPATPAARSAQLAYLTSRLKSALRQYPDFPTPGVLFEDILPIFANPELHKSLIDALEIYVRSTYGSGGDTRPVDVVVGLEARGFLFGPSLALRLGAGFTPVRKKGKLPGETVTAGFKKEYGEDFFQVQKDAIKKGDRVVIVDDIIATGGSAAAAGDLVKQVGGELLGYVFMMELDFLKGRDKLSAPVYTLFAGQEEKL